MRKKGLKRFMALLTAFVFILGSVGMAFADTVYVGNVGFDMDKMVNDDAYNDGFNEYFATHTNDPFIVDMAGMTFDVADYLNAPDGTSMPDFAASNPAEAPAEAVIWDGEGKPGESVGELTVENVEAVDANTISVKFEGIEEAVKIELEEALVEGENEITFTYKGQEFTWAVDYEAPADELVVKSVSAINATTIKVVFSNDDVVTFTVPAMQTGKNIVEFEYQGKTFSEEVEYDGEYVLEIKVLDEELLADGKTVMKIEAEIIPPEGLDKNDFIGDAVFNSLRGLKAAQAEAAFNQGKVVFNVTLPNSENDIEDKIFVKIIRSEDPDAVGIESETLVVTYKAHTPGGTGDTIQTYTIDSIKSADLADRVIVYVGGVADNHRDAVADAIVKQVKIYNNVAFANPIDVVGIAKITQSGNGYAYTALLDLPPYGTDPDEYNVMFDNQYNYYSIEPSEENIKLTASAASVDNKFMLIDRTKPSVQDVRSPKADDQGQIDEKYLPANTLLVVYSEPVNRLTAEAPENYVLNGHKLLPEDVSYIRVLDIKTEEDEVGQALVKLDAVDKTKERNSVVIKLRPVAAKKYLVNGENLLQAKSIADWAGLTDLSDNNKITTQDFIFNYAKPDANVELNIEKQSPEQYLVTLDALFVDENATVLADLAARNIDYKIELLDPVTKLLVVDVTDETRIVKLKVDPVNSAEQYLLELTEDWTQILAEPTAYHNKYYRITLGKAYDIYGNVASGELNAPAAEAQPIFAEVQVPEDTISPKVATVDGKKAVIIDTVDNPGYAIITMNEPVQLFDANDDYVLPGITPSLEQENGNGVPVPTFEYVKLSQSEGDLYSAGTKIAGQIDANAMPVDEYDLIVKVEPTKVLEPGDWKLVVRQISDDVGNTMSTEEFPFTIEGIGDNIVDPYIIWAYADDDKVNEDGTINDYVYILYSRQMTIDVLRAANYDINGKQVEQDADITSEAVVLYRQNSNINNANYNKFYNADNMPMWRGQLVTIQLPADFIISGDDLDGDINGLYSKNVLTIPKFKAVDDGIDETVEELLFTNNEGSNQYELTFDKGYGLIGYGVKLPAIEFAGSMLYATAEAHFTNEPIVVPGDGETTVNYSISKPGFLFVLNVAANNDLPNALYAAFDANDNQLSDKVALGQDAPLAPTVTENGKIIVKIFDGANVIATNEVTVSTGAEGSFGVTIPEPPVVDIKVTFTKPGFLYVANVIVDGLDNAATYAVYDAQDNQLSDVKNLGEDAPVAPTVQEGDEVTIKIFDANGNVLDEYVGNVAL